MQDSVDHEVYKMIGRHGSSLALSRGIVAEGSLRAVGSAGERCGEIGGSIRSCEQITEHYGSGGGCRCLNRSCCYRHLASGVCVLDSMEGKGGSSTRADSADIEVVGLL